MAVTLHDPRIHGVGLGFRHPFAEALFERPPRGLRWLEIHPENYLSRGGRFEQMLADASTRYPIATHGLTLGFGAVEPYDAGFLHGVRGLLEQLRTPWHSDHLCFAGVDGAFVHDLIPLPRNRETVDVVVDRVRQAQDGLGLPIAVEHISYYVDPPGCEMGELEFLCEVLERADAHLLLDVNNVFVNAQNHGFDAAAFVDALPLERVAQLHVAGHLVRPDGLRIDTHGEAVCEGTFELLEHTLRRLARPVAVLLERDDNFPDFDELAAEVERLSGLYDAVLGAPTPSAQEGAHP